ncbi:hypothetical protein V8C37DRAFT_393634 [Trichoderma ceciliae]
MTLTCVFSLFHMAAAFTLAKGKEKSRTIPQGSFERMRSGKASQAFQPHRAENSCRECHVKGSQPQLGRADKDTCTSMKSHQGNRAPIRRWTIMNSDACAKDLT